MEAFLLLKVCAKKDLGSTNTCANLYQINGHPPSSRRNVSVHIGSIRTIPKHNLIL